MSNVSLMSSGLTVEDANTIGNILKYIDISLVNVVYTEAEFERLQVFRERRDKQIKENKRQGMKTRKEELRKEKIRREKGKLK